MNSILSDKVVSISEARKHLPHLLEEVRRNRIPVSITQGSRADIVLLPRDDVARLYQKLEVLESLLETEEILADEGLMKKLRESEKEARAGKLIPLALSRRRARV